MPWLQPRPSVAAYRRTPITLPSLFFCIAAYRLDRPPEIMLLLNDMCWMILVIPFVTFVSGNFASSYAIWMDKRPRSLFPRWFALASCIWPCGFYGGLALHAVYCGAFAWNGGFTFWTGAAAVGIGTTMTVYCLLKAIDTTDEECETGLSLAGLQAKKERQDKPAHPQMVDVHPLGIGDGKSH